MNTQNFQSYAPHALTVLTGMQDYISYLTTHNGDTDPNSVTVETMEYAIQQLKDSVDALAAFHANRTA